MGKSRAEIQRDYRKRKLEKEGENFKQKERERAKKYYVPIADRSKKDVKLRREKVRLLVQKHRDKKRTESELMRLQVEENTTQNTTDREAVDITEDENQVSSTVTESGCQHQGLVVRLPLSSPKGRNVRKRISRVAARQSREIKKLREENTKLQRKYKTVCKRYERKTKALRQHPAAASSSTEGFSSLNSLTPSKRTPHELRSCGVSPSKLPKRVLKKLVLSNVVTDEVRAARNNTGIKGKKLINQIISGAIVKKYRMGRTLASRFRMKRQNLLSNTKRCTVNMKRRYRAFHEKAKAAVETFLSRDDNSRQMPGKSDFKRVHNEQKQRRILSDSMKNLFFKYSSENEECKMSFPTFCRLRPHHIALTKYLSKNNCLCQRHQNMALLLKSLKSMNANVPLNPEDYVRKVTESGPDSYLSEVTEEEVPFQQWQKVECQDGKKRMKIVEKKISKQAFIELFQKNTAEFVAHCDRIKQQYKALQDLKEGLPENPIILQMDFAEKFACSSADEVQSAYWNCCLVALHPVVMYYKSVSGQLLHRSYVLVSDDIGHNAGTVYDFLKELLKIIQEDMGDVKWVHYGTVSPSSQYRNKTIFYLVSDHHSLFGMQASWNYFESGHGKGPCDGIGGTSKRMADLAVRQRKVTIQDAREYFAWGAKYHTTSRYVLVEGSRITPIRQELQELIRSVIPLKGTMKIHAVASLSYGVIRNRTTSCK